MPDNHQTMQFDFKAHIETTNQPVAAKQPAATNLAGTTVPTSPQPDPANQGGTPVPIPQPGATNTPDATTTKTTLSEEALIDSLNQDNVQLSDELRLEIKKSLANFPNQYTVQVTSSFYPGSVIVAGTVLFIAWKVVKPIVGDAALKAVEAEITPIIQFAIKKVLSSFLARCNIVVTDPLLVNVFSVPNSSSSINQQSTLPQSIPRLLLILTMVNGLLLIILLILLVIALAPHIQIK